MKNIVVPKGIIKVSVFFILLSYLFPPFHVAHIGKGYSFIFDPPDSARIDFGVLLVQWIGILILAGLVSLIDYQRHDNV